MEVLIGKKRIRINPSRAIGKGGEADIYDIGGGKALKLFKPPTHPDFEGLPNERAGAVRRIEEHQRKLLAMPRNLPRGVTVPQELVHDLSGKRIVGYTLNFITPAEVLLRYGERDFREPGVSDREVVEIFKSLHAIVSGVHRAGVVIGDFNDLNVLVRGQESFLIDVDSAQFGDFYCRVFTGKFVDPLLCQSDAKAPFLIKPHNELSDWYAFVIMLMQSLLYVGPYGGVYMPKNKNIRIPHDARSLHRISVFHPEVRYPKPVRPLNTLPDGVLSYLQEIFEKDRREPFPDALFAKLQFDAHGTLLAVLKEPMAETRVKEVVTGVVTATKVFMTAGRILYAAVQGGELKLLSFEDETYRREDGTVVMRGPIDPHMRYRIQGEQTLVAKGNQAFLFSPENSSPEQLSVETYGQLPLIDANDQSVFFIANGVLNRIGTLGAQYYDRIGDVLPNQTLFWVGSDLGFGFYRAGNLCQYFVFYPKSTGINDSVVLPPIRGQLVDSTCCFGSKRIWFLLSVRENGEAINYCYLLDSVGKLIASAKTSSGDGSWLGTIRGKCSVGDKFLLAATDDGISRIEAINADLVVTKEFPDAARFVDSEAYLFPGKTGLVVVRSNQEVWNLQIK